MFYMEHGHFEHHMVAAIGLVIIKLYCYGIKGVFYSVSIVIIIIFRFTYKSSIF